MLKRTRGNGRNMNKMEFFYNIWNAKFQWAKLVLGVDGKANQLTCKVCSKIKERKS